ncbi:RabGAP/TBC [Lepidopterella palustris CBS 459.81]|uniref:RabGAP/TBC n=1 Tax=Lepidopterella palustris CBS 459.81 TaxID=1314670 RepID=A0A8E2EFY5_9PEZI|nr:RabGAP/TBC [Lepidopterella palustris CBS 459.81]
MTGKLQDAENKEIGSGGQHRPVLPIEAESDYAFPSSPPYTKFTPPASPKDVDTSPIALSKSVVPIRLKRAIHVPAETSNLQNTRENISPTSSPELPNAFALPRTIPPPHLPLRKTSSQLLRQRVLPPLPSPLNEEEVPRDEQPSPTQSISSGRLRQESATDEDVYKNKPLPSNPTTPRRSFKDERQWPLKSRARGQTTSSHASSQFISHHILRPSMSIPDLGPIRAPNRNGPSTTYKPDRGHPGRESDAFQYSARRDPFSRSDEARASFRSGWTNASSGFLDASGTERSSVVTKRSSTSDNRTSYHEQQYDGEEGMSVEEVFELYADGFHDDPAADENFDVGDEGYVSQAALAPSPRTHEMPIKPRRHSASMTERDSIGMAPPQHINLHPPTNQHVRSSTQIITGKTVSIQQDTESSEPVPRDRYGFKKATQYVTVEQYDAWSVGYTENVARRRRKWEALMKQYNLPMVNPTRFPPRSDKVKRYIRKGIPPEWRGAAWFWYAGGPAKMEQQPGLYWDLIEQVDNGGLNETDRDLIERDLNRTFPDNIRFKPDYFPAPNSTDSDSDPTLCSETAMLRALRRVLQAFAVNNPNIGYCQSLNFLAGLLLLFLDEDEEKAFIMLSIITTIHLPGTHGRVLEANVDMGVLMSCIRESMPGIWAKIDDVYLLNAGPTHMKTTNARLPTISLATTAWFMSLFVGNLPIETVLRVWDSFFYEGSKTLFRISLAIFKVGESEIRSISDHMEIFQVIQTIPRRLIDPNKLMEACFRRRNGFGHLSQETIDTRRADRRKLHVQDMARLNNPGGGDSEKTLADSGETRPDGLRRTASKRFKRSISRRRAKNG